MEIVLNEKEWVEKMVADHRLGDKPYLTLLRYAIYLRERGYDEQHIRRKLEDHIIRCDPNANTLRWGDAVSKAVKDSAGKSLAVIDGVPITSEELEKIKGLIGLVKPKVMFTLLCLAKYRVLYRKNSNGWVNYSFSDVFRLANVSLSTKRQMRVIHDLCVLGMLGYSHTVDNTSVRINIISEGGEPVIFIRDFRNLGNQYMKLIGEPYFECAECGIVVRQNSNAQKYCKACAAAIHQAASVKDADDVNVGGVQMG